MSKRTGLTVGLVLLALAVIGCTETVTATQETTTTVAETTTTTVAPTTTTTVAPTTTQPPLNYTDIYLYVVREEAAGLGFVWVDTLTDDELVELGHAICDDLRDGNSDIDIVVAMLDVMIEQGWDTEDDGYMVGFVIGSAQAAFCETTISEGVDA